MKKPYQPKDSGKLTNFHYGSLNDHRDQEALTTHGVKDMEQIDSTTNENNTR